MSRANIKNKEDIITCKLYNRCNGRADEVVRLYKNRSVQVTKKMVVDDLVDTVLLVVKAWGTQTSLSVAVC